MVKVVLQLTAKLQLAMERYNYVKRDKATSDNISPKVFFLSKPAETVKSNRKF